MPNVQTPQDPQDPALDQNQGAPLEPIQPSVETPGMTQAKSTRGSAKPPVTFTPEQIDVISQMFKEHTASVQNSGRRGDSPNAVSMYNVRDSKSIETVKVNRFDNGTGMKWVIGYKNLQNDKYKKTPKYLRYGIDPIRKLHNEPYITLLLSDNGEETVEKEVMLVDYMQNRDQKDIPVVNIKIESVINDHGVLGSRGEYAGLINEKGNLEARPTILAQSKSEIRVFTVQLPDFPTTTDFSTDFLG